MTDKAANTQVYRIVIKASAQAIWDAITKPEWTERYAYEGRVKYDLKPGGKYHHEASPDMKAVGLPEVVVVGEVLESDPPRKLVQTWHPLFTPEMIAEPPSRLTYEIVEGSGVCTVTIIHDVTGAPLVGGMVKGGGDPAKGGGGWPWVLSDLKSLLETGKRM
ncbi:MAG TPA: SRPBCC domain-containing protein [Hyphomicrobiaceae bacterium]|nr:SRPBCC domain-containing protein [Hyphomicrobiaceae bacterium]